MTLETLQAIREGLIDPSEIDATVFELNGKLALNGCLFTVKNTIFLITATYEKDGLWYCDVKNTSTNTWKPMLHDDVCRIVKEEQIKKEQPVKVINTTKRSKDEQQKRLNFDI